jgi:hypothetical protein
MMRRLVLGGVLLAAVLTVGVPAEAQQRADTWRVAFDDEGNEFRKALVGTLELRDGVLHFRADNQRVAWSIALSDVKDITRSEGYAEDSKAVLIESLSGERLYVAMLDKHFLFDSPKKVLKTLGEALKKPSNARSAKAGEKSRTVPDGKGGGN